MSKKKIILVILILCGIMVVYISCRSKKINLNDYFTYEVTGYNHYGSVNYTFDQSLMEQDIFKIIGIDADSSEAMEISLLLDDAINYSWSTEMEGLKNGDKLEGIWVVSKNILKDKYKIVFTYTDISEKVEGLQESDTYDIFADLKINETGINGEGSLEFDDSNVKIKNLDYSIDATNGSLSNGDKVKIILLSPTDLSLAEYCITEKGVVPKSDSYEYTVSNLEDYLSDVNQISDDVVSKLKEESENNIKAEQARTMGDEEELKGIEYIGLYVLHAKYGVENPISQLFVINRVTVKNTDGKVSFYHYCKYEDVTVSPEGKISIDYNNVSVPENTWTKTSGQVLRVSEDSGFYYVGYVNLKTFEKAQIISNIDKYTYTTNIK